MRIFKADRDIGWKSNPSKPAIIMRQAAFAWFIKCFRPLFALFLTILIVCGAFTLEAAKAIGDRFGKASAVTLTRSTETAKAEKLASTSQDKLIEAYGKLPISFEANLGQIKGQAKFLSRGNGYSLFMSPNEVILNLSKPVGSKDHINGKYGLNDFTNHPTKTSTRQQYETLRIKLIGANTNPQMNGLGELAGKVNYFIGNDSRKWVTNIRTYSRVQYKDVYPGINQIYYGNQQQLEYDFVVAPGADPKSIKLSYAGMQDLSIDSKGDLVIRTKGGIIRQHTPLIYQEINHVKQVIPGRYVLRGKKQVGFEVSRYNVKEPLIIDPVLSYSTFFGGSGNDISFGIAVDNAGNAYVTGSTDSSELSALSGTNTFVAKLSPDGTQRAYLAILGGSGDDTGFDIVSDGEGNVYVTGSTNSPDFPQTNAEQPTFGGGSQDAFVAKLNPAGSTLAYSTYLGGSGTDAGFGIAVDNAGNAYITGSTDSTELSTLTGTNIFVAKLNAVGNQRPYLAILGGGGDDVGFGVVVDSSGSTYIVGSTDSTNFTTANPLQPNSGGSQDAFIAKLNPNGSALTYSTYFGGSGIDAGFDIAIDSTGSAYITGSTDSPEFTTLGGRDVFVAKISALGNERTYFTILGGSEDDTGFSIALDDSGSAYITGASNSANFTTASSLQPKLAGGQDAFVAKLNPAGASLINSSYLGGDENDAGFGIAVDSTGSAYIIGFTTSTNFITASPMQSAAGGGGDAFVTKITALDTPSNPVSTLQFSQASYSVAEGAGFLNITVSRVGDKTSSASVKYATSDTTDVNFRCDPTTQGQPTGVASRKCDYHIAVGVLRFDAGEDTKRFTLSISDDVYVEGPETFTLTLSQPSGASLDQNSNVQVTITDDDTTGKPNPIDNTRFFVRQLYIDLLSREPDPAGWDGWTTRIDQCGQPGQPPPPCDRVTVGGDGFLRSGEFFDRQFFVLRLYRTGLGRILRYEDVGDLAYVSGFLTAEQLELNKQALVAELVSRPEFANRYNGLNDILFIDTLLQTASISVPADVRLNWITSLATKSRAQVFREISERPEVSNKYLHEAQVVSAYYGFFTRNPDGAYLNYLQRLDSGEITLGDLANAFINAAEYRQRFGQ